MRVFAFSGSSKIPLAFLFLAACSFFISCDGTNRPMEKPAQESVLLQSFTHSGEWLDISNESSNSRATFWRPDGSLVFVVGRGSDNVVAYELSDSWEIASAIFSAEAKVSGSNQHGLYFREDGEMMWVFDRTGIWTYYLENPWDISTLSEGVYTDLDDFVRRGHDIDFRPDGARLFIDDRNEGKVFQLDLEIPWDVNSFTLNYTLDISDLQEEVRGLEFLDSGLVMVLMDTGRRQILQFDLTEPWDISTASFAGVFDVSAQTSQGRGLSFSTNEDYFYVTCRDEGRIYQYQLDLPE
ncbi:MAG: hypothetical protein EA409_05750 [Saprospirales bacterium]|nr:MAG: hypothetical protein EA409_05750 [Saprospirales bacterium]